MVHVAGVALEASVAEVGYGVDGFVVREHRRGEALVERRCVVAFSASYTKCCGCGAFAGLFLMITHRDTIRA